MSQAKDIVRSLESVFRERSFDMRNSRVRQAQNSYRCQWKSEDAKVKAEILQEDSIGFMLNALYLEKDIVGRGEDYLRQIGETIERRINYLSEPLRILEVDSASSALLLRSSKPELMGNSMAYYEAILRQGAWFGRRNHLSLRRYTARRNGDEPRQGMAFPLAKRELEKLIGDLLEIL